MLPVLAFDMNGTLLDTAALDPLFDASFRIPGIRREWFSQLIELAMTSALTGYYTEFSKLAGAALKMVSERRSLTLSDEVSAQLLKTMRHLPAFPDVLAALQRLKSSGLRLVVLTNSSASSAEESLSVAGIRSAFERILSVEMVQRYKPAPEVYRYAAIQLGVSPADMMLVAAHSWDTTGAIRAGCRAAFLHRPGEVLDPLSERPEILAADLHEFAEIFAP